MPGQLGGEEVGVGTMAPLDCAVLALLLTALVPLRWLRFVRFVPCCSPFSSCRAASLSRWLYVPSAVKTEIQRHPDKITAFFAGPFGQSREGSREGGAPTHRAAGKGKKSREGRNCSAHRSSSYL